MQNCRPLLLAAALASVSFAGDTPRYDLASAWRSTEIKIDGAADEWTEAFAYLEKERIGIGLKNDSTALYVCLRFDELMQQQVLRQGFTLWLDASAKNKKNFGVRFPLGMANFDKTFRGEPQALSDRESLAPFAAMLRELEIIGPEQDERNRVPAFNAYGILAAAAQAEGELVCEITIPLKNLTNKPYAFAAELGQTVSLGFELGEINRAMMRERMGREGGYAGRPGGPPAGGFPGGGPPRGGHMGGGFGGGRPPGMEQNFGALKVWKRVHIAASRLDAGQGLPMLDVAHVSLHAEKMSLREALQKIVSQTNLQIVYSDALVKEVEVSCACKDLSVRSTLDELLRHTALDYEITSDEQIVIVRRSAKP